MKDMWKDKPRVKKLEKEKTLSLRTSQGYHFMKIATLGEGDGSNEEGRGRNKGEHKKGESRR